MKSRALGVAFAFCLLVLLTVLGFEGRSIGQKMGWVEHEAVLVFVIPRLDQAHRVRAALAPDRIVWQGEQGLALVGARVVASSLDDAGDVIERAGWVDRPIQIVRLDAPGPEEGGEPASGSTQERLAKLRSLVNKPMLTPHEQMFVLMAMNDGIEI
jgi:hypothetical protein